MLSWRYSSPQVNVRRLTHQQLEETFGHVTFIFHGLTFDCPPCRHRPEVWVQLLDSFMSHNVRSVFAFRRHINIPSPGRADPILLPHAVGHYSHDLRHVTWERYTVCVAGTNRNFSSGCDVVPRMWLCDVTVPPSRDRVVKFIVNHLATVSSPFPLPYCRQFRLADSKIIC